MNEIPSKHLIIVDDNIVPLTTADEEKESGYINASYIDVRHIQSFCY